MALLESGLPRDLIGRDRAAVDGRAVALVCRCQAAPGHRTDDAAQCRSSDVLAHGGEVLGGRRAAAWVDARRAAELDPPFAIGLVPVHHPVDDEELTPCVAWATVAVVAHVEVVAVPADDLVRPELSVVGHADDGAPGLLGGRGGQRHCLLDGGGRALDAWGNAR